MLRNTFTITLLLLELIMPARLFAEQPIVTSPSQPGTPSEGNNIENAYPKNLSSNPVPTTRPKLSNPSADAANFAKLLGSGTANRFSLFSYEDLQTVGRGAEFLSGYYKGAVLIPVELWGAVKQTGIHHIPTQTSLTKLITLAGGPTAEADLDELVINRKTSEKNEIIKVNLNEFLSDPKITVPTLQPGDIVVVSAKKPWISNNAVSLLSITAGILGIIVSGLIIDNQLRNR